MEDHQQTKNLTFKEFTWTIESFSNLNVKKVYSEIFIINGHQWRVLLFPKGNNNRDHLSAYLDVPDAPLLPQGWKRHACFRLGLINQVDSRKSFFKETQHEFNKKENDWGFTSFIPFDEFSDSNRGYLVQDRCIIQAKIGIENQEVTLPMNSEDARQGDLNVTHEEPTSDHENSTREIPIDQTIPTEIVEKTPSSTPAELVDFKGLCQINKAFVPLLEVVCTLHPSLIECQRKRSRKFAEWAFTALGRILHFLEITKMKEVTKEACEHLRVLWEEANVFRFDLTWLENHVQSILDMNNYLQKAKQVDKFKNEVIALEITVKKLQARLSIAEMDLEVAERNLAKAAEGFEERDMEAVLGYGSN